MAEKTFANLKSEHRTAIVHEVLDMLKQGQHKHVIYAKIREIAKKRHKIQKVSGRTCEKYISRARILMFEATGKAKDDHIAEAYWYYWKIRSDDTLSAKDKIAAQTRIDKLLGLEKPIKVAETDTEGNDVPPDPGPDKFAAILAALVDRQRAGGSGGDTQAGTAAEPVDSPRTNKKTK